MLENHDHGIPSLARGQYLTRYNKYGADLSYLPAELSPFPWQIRQIPSVIGVGTCCCQNLFEILIAVADSAMESSIAIANARGPLSEIIMPYVQTAPGPLPHSPFLDAPPLDNAAKPEETATPNHVEPPEKDLAPEDPASPESGNHTVKYPSRQETSLTSPQILHAGSTPWTSSTISRMRRVYHCRREH